METFSTVIHEQRKKLQYPKLKVILNFVKDVNLKNNAHFDEYRKSKFPLITKRNTIESTDRCVEITKSYVDNVRDNSIKLLYFPKASNWYEWWSRELSLINNTNNPIKDVPTDDDENNSSTIQIPTTEDKVASENTDTDTEPVTITATEDNVEIVEEPKQSQIDKDSMVKGIYGDYLRHVNSIIEKQTKRKQSGCGSINKTTRYAKNNPIPKSFFCLTEGVANNLCGVGTKKFRSNNLNSNVCSIYKNLRNNEKLIDTTLVDLLETVAVKSNNGVLLKLDDNNEASSNCLTDTQSSTVPITITQRTNNQSSFSLINVFRRIHELGYTHVANIPGDMEEILECSRYFGIRIVDKKLRSYLATKACKDMFSNEAEDIRRRNRFTIEIDYNNNSYTISKEQQKNYFTKK